MAKSDWEVVKDPKKKPAVKESPNASAAQKAKKVTPKAVITATGDNKSKASKKVFKKNLSFFNKIPSRSKRDHQRNNHSSYLPKRLTSL